MAPRKRRVASKSKRKKVIEEEEVEEVEVEPEVEEEEIEEEEEEESDEEDPIDLEDEEEDEKMEEVNEDETDDKKSDSEVTPKRKKEKKQNQKKAETPTRVSLRTSSPRLIKKKVYETNESDDEDEEEEEKKIVEIPVEESAGGDVEKIFCHKINEDGENEYMVKRKGKSYLHIAWVKEKDFLSDRVLKSKLQRYNRSPTVYDECADYFNPSFLEVDRVISKTKVGNQTKYLIKWHNLTYFESTWELAKDIKDDFKIEEFNKREENVPKDVKEKPRPDATHWVAYKESPIYKNANTLREYQLVGLNWLTFCWYNQRNSILADEMGLGKTVQTVSVIHHIYSKHSERGPFLIIAPLSTIPHWKREFENWTDMNSIVYHGNFQSREIIRQYEWKYDSLNKNSPVVKFNVLITTYEMIMQDMNVLNKIKWKYVATDEAHRLKNKNCKLISVLKTFKFDHLLLLTGTPLQNNTQELWTLLNFMDNKAFASFEKFGTEFGELKETSQVEKLHDVLRPYLLRRMKEDVEKSIAPKEETIIEVELTGIQKKYYRAIYDKNFSSLNLGVKASNIPSLLNVMMQLRKCCNHPYLIKGVEDRIVKEESKKFDLNQLMIKSSGKLVLIDKLLPKLRDDGHKVLIFSQMVRMLDILEDYVQYKGYSYERIDGTKRGNERQEAIDRFCDKGSDKFVFLLCTKAGGLGINLTAADTCIIYDSDWNPQNDLQAQARCHRIGQTQMVKVYRLITRNTYESFMFEKASKKLGLDRAVLTKMRGANGSGNLNNNNSMSNEDLRSTTTDKKEIEILLKFGAYAFLQDDTEDKYDEEDIDKILQRSSRVIKSSNDSEEFTPSSFSKASFVSEDAAHSAGVDLFDPDFWSKIMPEKNVIKEKSQVMQEGPRTRKQSLIFRAFDEDDFDDQMSDSEEDYESEKEKVEDKNRDWTHSERSRFKKAILEFGYGQWNSIKNSAQLTNWSLPDIRSYADTMLQKCLYYLDEDMDSTLEIIQYHKNENGMDNEAKNYSRPFDSDKSLNNSNFESFKQRNAKIIVRRLETIGRIYKIIVDYFSEYDTDNFNLYFLKDVTPTSNWTIEDDKSLILGIYYHGYGKYDKMRDDPRLTFYKKFPLSSSIIIEENKNENITDNENNDNNNVDIKKEDSEDSSSKVTLTDNINDGSSNNDIIVKEESKDEMKIESNEETKVKTEESEQSISEQIEVNNDNSNEEDKKENIEITNEEFPSPFILNYRIKKLVRLLASQGAKEKPDKGKDKESEKQRIKDEKKKKREDLWMEWSKREKLDFYRTIVTHGIPISPVTDEPDWQFIKTRAKLNRKSLEQVKEYCEGVIIFSENTLKKYGKDIPGEAPSNANANNNTNTNTSNPNLVSSPTIEGRTRSKSNYNQSPLIDDQNLTVVQCKRLLSRIKMFKDLREKVLSKKEILPTLLKSALRSTTMPAWWRPEFHDYDLLLGVDKHGFSQWEKICSDPSLSFYVEAAKVLGLPLTPLPVVNNNNISSISSNSVPNLNDSLDDGNGMLLENDDGGNDNDDDLVDDLENKIEEKEISCSTSFASTIKFPKDKIALKRIEYLIKYINVQYEKHQTRILQQQQQQQQQIKSKRGNSNANNTNNNNKNNTANNRKAKAPEEEKKKILTKRGRSPPPPPPSRVATKKYNQIPLDENGTPIFPILLGKFTILSLGQIEYENPLFHNERYIWPIGFKSVRTYRSFRNPDNTCEYTSEIVLVEDHPEFVVTANDALDEPSIGTSPTAAWSNILKKINEACGTKKNDKKSKRVHTTVSGPEYFGLVHGTICKDLPNAEKCAKYKFLDFVYPEEKSKSTPKKKRKLDEYEDSFELSPINNNNNTNHNFTIIQPAYFANNNNINNTMNNNINNNNINNNNNMGALNNINNININNINSINYPHIHINPINSNYINNNIPNHNPIPQIEEIEDNDDIIIISKPITNNNINNNINNNNNNDNNSQGFGIRSSDGNKISLLNSE